MPDEIDIQIGNRIRDLRRERDQTLVDLGHQLGISYQQVRKYEMGTNRISAAMLLRVAHVLGRNVSYFYEGVEVVANSGGTNQYPEADPLSEALTSIKDDNLRSTIHDLVLMLRKSKKHQ